MATETTESPYRRIGERILCDSRFQRARVRFSPAPVDPSAWSVIMAFLFPSGSDSCFLSHFKTRSPAQGISTAPDPRRVRQAAASDVWLQNSARFVIRGSCWTRQAVRPMSLAPGDPCVLAQDRSVYQRPRAGADRL